MKSWFELSNLGLSFVSAAILAMQVTARGAELNTPQQYRCPTCIELPDPETRRGYELGSLRGPSLLGKKTEKPALYGTNPEDLLAKMGAFMQRRSSGYLGRNDRQGCDVSNSSTCRIWPGRSANSAIYD